MRIFSTDMKKPNSTNKRRVRNDILLVAVLLLLATAGAIYLFVFRSSGDMVEVTVDGEVYGVYTLSQDRVEDIYTGENGEQWNRLVIREGRAFVETATCPDGICSNHRAIFRDGESIICLPHRVVIAVVAEEAADAPDAVV